MEWADVTDWLLDPGVRILIILIIGGVLWFILRRVLRPIVSRTMVRTKGESRRGIEKQTDTLTGVFTGIARIGVLIIVLLLILTELGVNIGPILAGFGVAGIAVGFGAQYLIRDLIAGVFVIMENQYRVGDVASVAGITALVEDITLRKTVMRDLDGVVHHVPNGEIRTASNYTRHFSRVNIDFPVAYGTNLDRAIEVMNRVGMELAEDENWKDIMITPPQVLRVNNLGDSGIDIKMLGEVKPSEQWRTMGELRLRMKKAFDSEGIEIPWPHTKVYFGNSPDNPEAS
ncbi:MAG: mechanosensitive ion channel family protein [Dehalococcoidales bacterium]|nr:MAG: mechanosensitive ion channel family protein [Dehalococcoidales bacterium]